MFIKEIEVRNFKSFKHLKLELGKLNLIVGANASGKSNFTAIFRFLRNIARYGLNNAISLEGGIDLLRNMQLGHSENLYFKIKYELNTSYVTESFINVYVSEATYEFEMQFPQKNEKRFSIIRDNWVVKYDFKNLTTDEHLGSGYATCLFRNGEIKTEYKFPPNIDPNELSLHLMVNMKSLKNSAHDLLLETPFWDVAHIDMISEGQLKDIPFYNFEPQLSQKAISPAGQDNLLENGENLSIVLNRILSDKEKKRKLINLLSYLLNFIKDARMEKWFDRLTFAVQEKYTNQFLPAFLLSDGTINVVALIVALYYDGKSPLFFEEPDRYLYPNVLGGFVQMLEEIGNQKQLFITTHNPELVRHANLEDLLLVARDKEGFSIVKRPSESESVRTFLENEIGLGELLVDDLLGV